MLVTGYWILVTGYWMLDTGYWILDAGCWILDISYSLLVICKNSVSSVSSVRDNLLTFAVPAAPSPFLLRLRRCPCCERQSFKLYQQNP